MANKRVLMFLENMSYWIEIKQTTPKGSAINASAKTTKDDEYYDDYEDSDLIVVWETAVQPLTSNQRLIFFILTCSIAIVAFLGNLLVLYVNFSRKQRLLFRTCLISLAVSDLIYILVTCSIYLPKMYSSTSALWKLGALACSLIPFLQTMVVLVNSVLLVCIALDRYMAVVRIVKGQWEPGKLFCVTCLVLIWGVSAGVSSPMLTIYDFYRAYIVPLPDPDEEDPVLTYYVGYLCGSDKSENAYYFAIIFSFIFVPLLMTFLWLNCVLAKEVWRRRNVIAAKRNIISYSSESQDEKRFSNESDSNFTNQIPTVQQESYETPEIVARRAERKQRQIRIFKVIVVLMLVFFICRLPNWVYVLYKLNNVTQENIYWVINYIVGLLVLLNCMLNPYLFTFLSETIRLTTFLSGIVCGIFRPCRKLCKSENQTL